MTYNFIDEFLDHYRRGDYWKAIELVGKEKSTSKKEVIDRIMDLKNKYPEIANELTIIQQSLSIQPKGYKLAKNIHKDVHRFLKQSYGSHAIDFCEEELLLWQQMILPLSESLDEYNIKKKTQEIKLNINKILKRIELLEISNNETETKKTIAISFSKECKECKEGFIECPGCHGARIVDGIPPRSELIEIILHEPKLQIFDKTAAEIFIEHHPELATIMKMKKKCPSCKGRGNILCSCANEITFNIPNNFHSGWVVKGRDTKGKIHYTRIKFSGESIVEPLVETYEVEKEVEDFAEGPISHISNRATLPKILQYILSVAWGAVSFSALLFLYSKFQAQIFDFNIYSIVFCFLIIYGSLIIYFMALVYGLNIIKE